MTDSERDQAIAEIDECVGVLEGFAAIVSEGHPENGTLSPIGLPATLEQRIGRLERWWASAAGYRVPAAATLGERLGYLGRDMAEVFRKPVA